MAGTGGREGMLVDVDAGVLRRNKVLAQSAPGALLFMGLGPEAARLCRFALEDDESDPDPFLARCRRIASTVESGEFAKEERSDVSHALLAIEDRSLRRLAIAELLAKANYNQQESRDWHGRWTDEGGGEPSFQIAQEDEETRPEDLGDPLAETRQALWDAGIATLRQIDPANPNLTYVANPGAAPGQAALDHLDAVIEAAAIKRVRDKVMPGGAPIGEPGSSADVRELPGGLVAARKLLDDLRVGGQTVDKPDLEGTLVKLPGNAGYITFRAISTSGPPAIDINVPGVVFKRIHFP